MHNSTHSRAFTLIEILVAMTIVIILTSLLAMGLSGSKEKASQKSSMALVAQIKNALESYHAEFRDYPPDGYDAGENGTGNGWNWNSQGVLVGFTPSRRVRGTASLIYFLCRPVMKVTRMSADPADTEVDVRKVGPFLTLENRNFSIDKITVNGEEISFDPNYPWASDPYWDVGQGQGINCEIIDTYGRPLCYDKVRTADSANDPTNATNPTFKFFTADLFQSPGPTTGTGTEPQKGINAHPDGQRYIVGGIMPLDNSTEPDAYDSDDPAVMVNYRMDPRFESKALVDQFIEGGGGAPAAGTEALGAVNTIIPKNVPGYNLWSAGRSWIDPRDDITSWGN